MQRYNPKEIEPKWQKIWEESQIYKVNEDPAKPKRYVLEYFPYPSGAAMHVGHVRNYAIGDAVARYARMRGFNVMHPMGWDAFGLPAENYAIKNNISPQQAIAQNTSRFKQQLSQMGFSYDWSRELNSSDPAYYKWTQWFFLLLLERGLAYQKDSLQWWCDYDKTVLANEQVEAGKCWRCGNAVSKKPLKQWFFKITDYADRLAEDLDKLDWSESIKSMQRNWIGKSKGAEIDFKIDDSDEVIRVFTTRPDTLYGATFMVLAPEHPLADKVTTPQQRADVEHYITTTQSKSDVERQETDREKTGVFTGAYAVNPVNGQKVPVWIADYVLFGYGTGAIMAVPAHDERDNEFAQKFSLPIVQVIEPETGIPQKNPEFRSSIVAIVRDPKTNTFLSINWVKQGGNLFIGGGRDTDEDALETARREIAEETGYTNLKFIEKTGRIWHNYYAHSKNVARRIEAYGLFFDLIDDTRQEVALDENEKNKFTTEWLEPGEVELKIKDELHATVYSLLVKGECFHGEGILTNSGSFDGMNSAEAREKIVEDLVKQQVAEEKINYKIRDWLISRQRYWGAPIPVIHCPDHGAVAVPVDQLPVVLPEVESYQPNGEGTSVLAGMHEWVNTTCPECGKPAKRETDTMDGFACSSWYFLRFADPHNTSAPFDPEKAKFWLPVDDYIGGAEHAVMHLLYARMWTKVMFDAGLINFDEPFKALRNHGMILAPDGRKMSKSWGNVIAPDDIIDQGYGADSIRIMELFIGPWNQAANWSVEGMGGCYRFLQRFWTLTQEYQAADSAEAATSPELMHIAHKAIKKVTNDMEHMSFNTAIATLMESINELYKVKAEAGFTAGNDWQFTLGTLSQLLAPFAPHIAEEVWQQLGNESSVHLTEWPAYDEQYLVESMLTIAVQINGKLRATVTVPADADQPAIEAAAKAEENVKAHLSGDPKRVIYVPGKLLNFVV
jgi:leucyl-tRNA synthetase